MLEIIFPICLGFFLNVVVKYPDRSNVWGKGFILAYSSMRDIVNCGREREAAGTGRREQEVGRGYEPPKPSPGDPHPSVTHFLLKVSSSQTFRTASPAGEQVFTYVRLWRAFLVQLTEITRRHLSCSGHLAI